MLPKDIKRQGAKTLQQILKQPALDEVYINIRVKLLFLGPIGDIDHAMIPAPYNIDFPYFIFGEFDRQGHYGIARHIITKDNLSLQNLGLFTGVSSAALPKPYYFQGNFVSGGFKFGSYAGAGALAVGMSQYETFNYYNLNKFGDVVDTYSQNGVLAPPIPYTAWVIVSMDSTSYASLCANTANEYYQCSEIRVTFDNAFQGLENIKKIITNSQGKFISNDIQPAAYKPPTNLQSNTIVIPVDFRIDQYFGLASIIKCQSNQIDYSFKCHIKHK
jgi:hypothetical protein